MIPFSNRFHGHNSLSYVYKNGTAVRSRVAVLKYIGNPHRRTSRLAVVISKKVVKSAVSRNRIRRRIYEYLRPWLLGLEKSHDVVVIVSAAELLTMDHGDFVQEINQLVNQPNIN